MVIGAGGLLGGAAAVACGSFGGTDAVANDAGVDATAGPDGSASYSDAGEGGSSKDAFDGSVDPAQCPVLLSDSFSTVPGTWMPDVSGGTIVSDALDYGDASPSLHSFALIDASAPAHAALYQTVQFVPQGLGVTQLSFAVKFEDSDGGLTYEETGCEIILGNAGGDETVALFSRYGLADISGHVGNTFSSDSGVPSQELTVVPPKSAPGWYIATITIVPVPGGATFTLALRDRATGKQYSQTIIGVPPTNVDHAEIGCGLTYAAMDPKDGGAHVSTHVDDVVLRHCTP